jgi:hypothetical protein
MRKSLFGLDNVLPTSSFEDGHSGGNTADEQQQAAGNLNKKSELPLQREKRVEKRERAADGNEESGPDRNGSCSPERDPKQRRTKDRANVKHHVIIAHDPILIELPGQRKQ